MVRFLLRVILSALGLWFAEQLHLVSFGNFESLAFAGLALGFLNAFVRPVLTFLTLIPALAICLGRAPATRGGRDPDLPVSGRR